MSGSGQERGRSSKWACYSQAFRAPRVEGGESHLVYALARGLSFQRAEFVGRIFGAKFLRSAKAVVAVMHATNDTLPAARHPGAGRHGIRSFPLGPGHRAI